MSSPRNIIKEEYETHFETDLDDGELSALEEQDPTELESESSQSNLLDYNLDMTTTDTVNRLLQSSFYDKTKYK